MPEALEAVAPFPFKLTGDDGGYAFSTDLRSVTTPAPATVQDLGFEAKQEWSDVRALINEDGTLQSVYVLKGSSDKAGKISSVATCRNGVALSQHDLLVPPPHRDQAYRSDKVSVSS
jgi:hypothetical protein